MCTGVLFKRTIPYILEWNVNQGEEPPFRKHRPVKAQGTQGLGAKHTHLPQMRIDFWPADLADGTQVLGRASAQQQSVPLGLTSFGGGSRRPLLGPFESS